MLPLYITLGVVGGYISTSVLFLLCPQILHKKKKQAFRCRHISHRGGAGENLENTMTAFRHAVSEAKTEMLEIDVHLTADKEIVVAHDNYLDRLTGSTGLISDCKYHELPQICETLDVTFTDGETVTCCNNDRQIPLLRDLFEEFPDVPMNIDLKKYNEELFEKCFELIREYKREHLVVLGNFNHQTLNYIHKKAPEMPTLFSMRKTMWTTIFFYLGLLPFIPLREEFFEVPLPRIILRNPNAFQNFRWLIRIADWLLMSPVLFRHLQRRGIQVYLFVINEEADFETCFHYYKVDGIMTDYPIKLQRFLQRDDVKTTRNTSEETEPIMQK